MPQLEFEEEEQRKQQQRPPPIPTLVVTSEDCEDEYCEFIEEKLKPNVPIKNAVMMLNELFPPPKAPQYKVSIVFTTLGCRKARGHLYNSQMEHVT